VRRHRPRSRRPYRIPPPGANDNNNPLPSSYLSGQHGARAAYETLLRSSYSIERWNALFPN